MEKIECQSEEELQALKTKAMKCKVILLDQWEKHPLTNPSTFNKRQKDRFLKELTTSDKKPHKLIQSLNLFTCGIGLSHKDNQQF